MSISDTVGLLKDIVTLLALLIGSLAAVFIYFQFAPTVVLRILPTWADDSRQHLLVRFEIENKSKVRLNRPKGKIQILEYDIGNSGMLSQFVPFQYEDTPQGEEPIKWREPAKILTHTRQIYPGETISYERLYHYPHDAVIIHIGLQIELELSIWGRFVTRKRGSWRQTTTCFVVKETKSDAKT